MKTYNPYQKKKRLKRYLITLVGLSSPPWAVLKKLVWALFDLFLSRGVNATVWQSSTDLNAGQPFEFLTFTPARRQLHYLEMSFRRAFIYSNKASSFNPMELRNDDTARSPFMSVLAWKWINVKFKDQNGVIRFAHLLWKL